jgi:hypothetical protein
MNLLNGDRMEELANFLDGNNDNQVGEAAVEQTEPNAVEAVETVQTQQDVQSEASSPSETEHQVPYGRFKEVINARNDLRSRNDDLERQLQELHSQMQHQQSVPTEQSTPSYENEFDNLYGNFDEPYEDEYSQRFQSMESRLEEFEIYQEQQKLEQELAYASDRYPGVPREALLTAVINNPEADVLDMAERYNTFVAGIRESAIADYAKTNGVQQQELPPAVPPRVTPGPSGQVATGFGDQQKPRNLDEAKNALFKFLQNR